MITLELPDEAATAALATRLAPLARPGDVIALAGELGAGKTSFARAFIRARGGAGPVPSPTFTLVQVYQLPAAALWHFDGYRLRDPEEGWELGIEEAFYDAIALVEWPERFGSLIPPRRLKIALSVGVRPQARLATIDPGGDWPGRLAGLGMQFPPRPCDAADAGRRNQPSRQAAFR
jgi:tRNA threonylcarbamoyladenosine biosynthesis protein TsaE